MEVTKKHLPNSKLLFVFVLVSTIAATYSLIIYKGLWGPTEFAITTTSSITLAWILWNFRRTVIGYKVYVGFSMEGYVVKLWNPLEPPPCDHGLVVNLATRRCTWVLGNREIRGLLSLNCRIRLANDPYEAFIGSPSYGWFIGDAACQPACFEIIVYQHGRVYCYADNLREMVNERLAIDIPGLHNALRAIMTLRQAHAALEDLVSNFNSTTRLSTTKEGISIGIQILELGKILNPGASHVYDRDISQLNYRTQQTKEV